MIGARYRAPVFAALLISATFAWSQPAADADSEPTDSEPRQPSAQQADTGDAAAGSTPPPERRSPTDYRSSEEISEDLSVSFPVDI